MIEAQPSGVPQITGIPQLTFQHGKLCLEQVALETLAEQYGTPLFAYSRDKLRRSVQAWTSGLQGRNARIFYAVKACSNLSILQLLADHGCGFDIVSGGELQRVLKAGGNAEDIVFSGVGKTRVEIACALECGVHCLNVESLAELDLINEIARSMGVQAPVSLRINPDVDAHTHPYIATGLKGNKFGISSDEALAAYERAAALPGLKIRGIDCHIGSQITELAPYLNALDKMLDLVERIEAAGISLEHLDLGGGLGVDYTGAENPPTPQELTASLLQRLDARGHGQRKLVFEPGRSLVAQAGLCLTEVLYLKPGDDKNFCIVDAAMNDLPRPSLYDAYHRIMATRQRPELAATHYDVVGPVCESGDWLGRERLLQVRAGDHLAILSAGAYCSSMASNYNSRPRAAEVLVDGRQHRLIRRRETTAELWQGEDLPQGQDS